MAWSPTERPSAGGYRAPRSASTHRWIAVVLLAAAVAPFARALLFGYVYDDTWIVQHNPAIQGWRSLLTLWRHPYWMDAEGAQAGLYRPVQTAMLAIVRNLGGGWPVWFHLYAIALHAAVTLLVWRLLARGVGRWPAALAALWFAVHPVHVEAVANISNSAESLAAFWTLALFFSLARTTGRGVRWRDAIAAALLYAAAMLSKESAALALPIALLAAVAWRQPGSAPSRVADAPDPRPELGTAWSRWWRVALAGALALLVVGVVRTIVLGGGSHSATMAAVGLETMRPFQRALATFSLGPRLLALLLWPGAHNPYYGPSIFPTGVAAGALATTTIVVLVAALLAALRLASKRGGTGRIADARPLAALVWMLLAFLPASNLLVATGQILAERTLYMSSVGAAMLIGWGIERAARTLARWRNAGAIGPQVVRAGVALGCLGIAAVCIRGALVARRGTEAWRSHRALIAQMIDADPRGYRGHYLLALLLRRANATDSAAREFATAYTLYPRDPQLNLDYARLLTAQRRPREAVRVSRELMTDTRMRGDADAIAVYLDARGMAYGADSVLAAAQRLFAERPHPTAALYLGLAHEARAERHAALEAYRAGLRLAPHDSLLAEHLAAVERTAGTS